MQTAFELLDFTAAELAAQELTRRRGKGGST
jgi:hypothetical protein